MALSLPSLAAAEAPPQGILDDVTRSAFVVVVVVDSVGEQKEAGFWGLEAPQRV
jgi:hypothetical protein